MLNEAKTASFSISVTQENDIVIEGSLEAIPGSSLAEAYAELAEIKTNQIGFIQSPDNFAVTGGYMPFDAFDKDDLPGVGSLFEELREAFGDGGLDTTGLAVAKSIVDDIEAMLISTVVSGKIEVYSSWRRSGTLLVGATIDGGNKLHQALIKSLVLLPQEFRQFVTLNTEQFEGFTISTVSVPMSAIPDVVDPNFNADLLPPALASRKITLHIAIKDSAVALALGLNNTALVDLKKAIVASKTPADFPDPIPSVIPANLADFVQLFAPAEPNENFDKVMSILSSFPPDAHITESQVHRGNVSTYTAVVSSKLLPGIGKFIKMAMEAAE